jgi:uncharacterized protein YecE (DUF72 family)
VNPPKAQSVLPAKERIFVGCSGWSYPTWKPDFYPQKLPAKKMLEFYATQLNSVEVNYTFRQMPSPTTIQTWLAATRDGFRFSFKAPQRITHIQRLRQSAEALQALVSALEPVAEAHRMGLVLFQLPPNFKADLDRLKTFLGDAGKLPLRIAFEFRHASWFAEDVFQALRDHNAALCIAESDDLETPDVITSSFSCYRLRISGGYTPEQLGAIQSRLQSRAANGDVFAYFKHEEAPTGALQAAAVLRALQSA